MKAIRKAVFPVAGLGTRFLPATKANPKEMLPIVDKPLIQFAAEEAVAAGIDVLIFIIGRNKSSIPDHFDKAYELEAELAAGGKHEMLNIVRNILPSRIDCVYIRQAEALGLGHAVLCAQSVVGDEPFAVLLADDLINTSERSCLNQMVDIYSQHHCSILGIEQVARETVNRYGIIDSSPISDSLSKVNAIVEKPAIDKAPSNLAVVGRYILTPRIFKLLEKTERGAGNEIQLTDAIAKLLNEETVLGYEFDGKRFDCGSKSGYLQATVEFALQHPELKQEFESYLYDLVNNKLEKSP
ncbi:MAG: UTP--glucose-1-phosphate uridylyltransferase GalU [Nitrosomonas sp.]|jgi:UTP--glucose-1-phosphate uridylyltransferase|uniref:UTP--glucose-1-phosphate uridylyltransferase GalU n=1 Tax=Nitrosomonas sp. TaxID=42353 RepID=UPI0027274A07|nr:UTP--glucose-1-phosphate uridylyltransferase GalU [Nitrosomonas sp.]MBK6958556.1 UTP--glucose-1-phosphate uridylyltransferase GalU [Nitrosomonas sp.]MDO8894595.1 UTP--glucose-1-phosphate uridylyltransferase GalU [Nitrosomonas sp.]MDO9311224.1 UTP--glucose-1-phosphate uridylyltransferase GalU [Nitrosomonas sp.]MDO9469849.1 UTP--glucose-1-phosphate uridylyltransferase GalU [Nitrosomonas sp.]MDP1548881.1 UTP--glucose-1-phosphate uridylyltransferase GalU [Nitrosomonas sp.]